MSEASRARAQWRKNRLEELAWKYGPLPERELADVEVDPSWGPVGSLAARTGAQDAAAPAPAQMDLAPEPAQNRVLGPAEAMRHLDRYGETGLFGCPRCGQESAKASVPIDLWTCTACGAAGRASRLAGPDLLPPTETQRV